MPNEKGYRYRHGVMNPVSGDNDTYTDGNPALESAVDRLHKSLKPQPVKKIERTTFTGFVVGILPNLGIEDLSAAQRAEVMGNPKKIKSFIVRIPESYSAAIPECLNVGSKKKELDDIYSQLEREITFIMLNPDLGNPGLGDLVRCDFLIRNDPSQGGVITEILGKQGTRSKNTLADKRDTTASEAINKEGQETKPVTSPEQPPPSRTFLEQLNELVNPLPVARNYVNKSFKGNKGAYPVTNFIEAIMFDLKKKSEKSDLIKENPTYAWLPEGFNPKSMGDLPLSYYANCSWASPSDLNEGLNSLVRKKESGGVVYGLVKNYDFKEIPVGATLQGGDIINIWTRESGKWVNSTAVVDSPSVNSPGDYNLIGTVGWFNSDGENSNRDIVTEYVTEIKDTENIKFWICRFEGLK